MIRIPEQWGMYPNYSYWNLDCPKSYVSYELPTDCLPDFEIRNNFFANTKIKKCSLYYFMSPFICASYFLLFLDHGLHFIWNPAVLNMSKSFFVLSCLLLELELPQTRSGECWVTVAHLRPAVLCMCLSLLGILPGKELFNSYNPKIKRQLKTVSYMKFDHCIQ